MDMQKSGPRGRSSSINPGPGAAVECKTPGVSRGACWCLELTDALGPKKFVITDMTCKARFCALGEEEVCRCLEVFR